MKTRNFFTLIIIALMVIAVIWAIAEKVATPFTIFLWVIIVTMGIREYFNEE